MIVGIGTDMVEIARVRKLLEQRMGERFIARLLTRREQDIAATRSARIAEYTAGRFAAKEAAAKAFGCGIGGTIGFHDLEIVSAPSGKPECRLSDDARKRLGYLPDDGIRIHLSITHSVTMAGAFVVVERIQSI